MTMLRQHPQAVNAKKLISAESADIAARLADDKTRDARWFSCHGLFQYSPGLRLTFLCEHPC